MSKVVKIKSVGNFSRSMRFLKFLSSRAFYNKLEHYAKKGVVLLAQATPKESGESADSWGYEIAITKERTTITWTNSNTTEDGLPIVLLVQYGHATRNGSWVEGYDFINPAIQPIFDDMADSVWKEIQNA